MVLCFSGSQRMAGTQRYPERPIEEHESQERSDESNRCPELVVEPRVVAVGPVSCHAVDECEEVNEVAQVDQGHPRDRNRPNRAQYTHTCICKERQAAPEAKQVRTFLIIILGILNFGDQFYKQPIVLSLSLQLKTRMTTSAKAVL